MSWLVTPGVFQFDDAGWYTKDGGMTWRSVKELEVAPGRKPTPQQLEWIRYGTMTVPVPPEILTCLQTPQHT